MRHAFLFAFAAWIFVAVTSAHGVEASCDQNKCMNICRSEYESGCAGMCGRIISLCRELVLKPEHARSTRRAHSAYRQINLDAQDRSSLGRID
jgi:hypothetical protein